jgi:hypothetical protein
VRDRRRSRARRAVGRRRSAPLAAMGCKLGRCGSPSSSRRHGLRRHRREAVPRARAIVDEGRRQVRAW